MSESDPIDLLTHSIGHELARLFVVGNNIHLSLANQVRDIASAVPEDVTTRFQDTLLDLHHHIATLRDMAVSLTENRDAYCEDDPIINIARRVFLRGDKNVDTNISSLIKETVYEKTKIQQDHTIIRRIYFSLPPILTIHIDETNIRTILNDVVDFIMRTADFRSHLKIQELPFQPRHIKIEFQYRTKSAYITTMSTFPITCIYRNARKEEPNLYQAIIILRLYRSDIVINISEEYVSLLLYFQQ